MKYRVLAVLVAAVGVVAQGVTDKIAPKAPAPPGCKPNVDGKFEVSVVGIGKNGKREEAMRKKRDACPGDGILVAQLKDGVITDAKQRVGYIADNYQFQFDGPPQAGAIFTAGFSYCQNGSLALGGSTVFWQCRSGSFYNLYDRWWAEQCSPVEIIVMPCGDQPPAPTPTSSQSHHVIGTEVLTTSVVIPLADGQPQVVETQINIPICEIGDGQVQGHSTPCAALAKQTPVHSPPPAPPPPGPPVSEFSDGQIQVTPVPPPAAASPSPPVEKPAPPPAASPSPSPPVEKPAPPPAETPSPPVEQPPASPSQPTPTSPVPSFPSPPKQPETTLRSTSVSTPVPSPTPPPGAPPATAGAATPAVGRGLVAEAVIMAAAAAVAWWM